MKKNDELFDTSQFEKPAAEEHTRRLFYATNATNMRGILSSGLIRPKSGWPKYVPDFQERVPGYIPLFCDGVPFSSLDAVTEHDKHDFPVILEFLAKDWDGDGLRALSEDGDIIQAECKSLPDSTRALLTEGVVPLADLQKVHFCKPQDAKRFLSDCRAMANTRPDLVPAEDDLQAVPDIIIPFPDLDRLTPPSSNYDVPAMRRVDAVGGVLSALLRMQGKGSHGLLRRVFPEWTPEWEDEGDTISGMDRDLSDAVAAWLEGVDHADAVPNAIILRLAMDFLAVQPFACGLSPEAFLDNLNASAEEHLPEHHEVLSSRLATIRASVLHDQEPARLFQETGSAVMRGMLLLLLDDVYREERRLPGGCSAASSDLLVAEVLRGALHGWTRVPVTMRGVQRAELAIGYAMARLSGGGTGCMRFPRRSFEWVDEQALLGRMLAVIWKGVSNEGARKSLQRFAAAQGATGIEVKISVKSSRKGSKPTITRRLKGKKSRKVCFQLDLPWE